MKNWPLKVAVLAFYAGVSILKGLDEDWSILGMVAIFAVLLIGGEWVSSLRSGQGLVFDKQIHLWLQAKLEAVPAYLWIGRGLIVIIALSAALLHGLSMEWRADSIVILCMGAGAVAYIAGSLLAGYVRDFGVEGSVLPLMEAPETASVERDTEETKPTGRTIRARYLALAELAMTVIAALCLPTVAGMTWDEAMFYVVVMIVTGIGSACSLYFIARKPESGLEW